ncbi:MAG: histidine phosphatase family protein [Acidimicrobiaceae bacterium]|nr:histidine phosphatase family protein [Acidimicrobiaceae bacterium]
MARECRLPCRFVPHPVPDSTAPALILLVRHGATAWSVSGRHTGRTDMALLPEGEAQAAAARQVILHRLAGAEPLIYTSPLQRARRTAELALPGCHAEQDHDLAEYDYGDYEGLTTSEILARDPEWDLFHTGCPGGETPHQVVARCDRFVSRLHREATGRAVVAFTHGHLSRVLTARLIELPASTAAGLWNDTASVGVVNLHRGRLVLVGWNVTAPIAQA